MLREAYSPRFGNGTFTYHWLFISLVCEVTFNTYWKSFSFSFLFVNFSLLFGNHTLNFDLLFYVGGLWAFMQRGPRKFAFFFQQPEVSMINKFCLGSVCWNRLSECDRIMDKTLVFWKHKNTWVCSLLNAPFNFISKWLAWYWRFDTVESQLSCSSLEMKR